MYNTDLPTRAELPSAIKLMQSTLLALIVALVLLVTVVLPSEYGIDPTGIGRVLGLKKMGEIKEQLAQEAVLDQAPYVAPAVTRPVTETPLVLTQNDAAALNAPAVSGKSDIPAPVVRRDQISITLKPNEAAEVKLEMKKDAQISYQWSSSGQVNVDAHGDPVNAPKDFYHGYGKGRQISSREGTLQAAFDGKHGWFWRNRSKSEVTIQLTTSGDYKAIKRVL